MSESRFPRLIGNFSRCITLSILSILIAACSRPAATTPPSAPANDAIVGAIRVSDGWIRATPIAGVSGAGYLRITNIGDSADTLLGGATTLAERVEVHQMANVDGVMQMRELAEGVEIPAGGSVELAPSGTHLMLMQVREPLKAGTTVPVELHFARAGKVKLDLPVRDGTAP